LSNLSLAPRIALIVTFCFLLTPFLYFSADPSVTAPDPYGVQFVDVTNKSGIHFHHARQSSTEKLYVETMGSGVGWLDYDQDGFMDAIFVNSGFTPLVHSGPEPQPALYRNNGDGTFTDVTAQSCIKTNGHFFAGVAVGDFDNDGYPDIYLTGYRHSVLYHNNHDGTFTDVTAHAGVADDGAWGTAAGWFDYDRDGKLDLLVSNYVAYDWDHNIVCGDRRPGYRSYCHPDNFHGTSPRLYHNNGDGTFTDVTEKAKLNNPAGKSLAVVLVDLNNDGWPDIFIANDTERNFVYLNNQDGTFKDITYPSGAAYSEDGKPEAGMSADAADLTGTNHFDLYVSHLDFELNRLYRNDGKANFNDETVESGLGSSNIKDSSFGARFFDFDNDGWRDLLVINGHILDNIPLIHSEVTYAEPKRLYRNIGAGRFADVSATQSTEFLAPHVGRGLAVGDFDNDGSLDFVVNNNGEEGQLFHNEGPHQNHWLEIHLVGTRSNRDGIGAHVTLTAGNLVSYDQAKGGMAYCSAQDPRLHFGLASHDKIDAIEISWPSGASQVLRDVVADQVITIDETRGITPFVYPRVKSK
jgi:enediyne biosynthesis protein E4